jgi:hypothetical protein
VEAAVTHPLRPLTDRILDGLPGARGLWIGVWALVPWANAALNLAIEGERTSAVWEQSRTLVILNYASLSIGVAIALWGSGRIARRLEELRTTPRFSGMNSVAGPAALAVSFAAAFAVSAFVRDGWGAALLRGATWVVLGVALWTFAWTYVTLMLGLDRLGREHLVRDAPPVDPGLGLRPLGGVAFMGLWMLLIWLVPVLLTALTDALAAAVASIVIVAALAAFFFSLFRLHRQMVEVKAGELEIARALYAQAYAPVQEAPTLEALERQRGLLSAADALEKRANAIHEWPIDEGTFARVLTITTSVVAMMIARLILDPLGL